MALGRQFTNAPLATADADLAPIWAQPGASALKVERSSHYEPSQDPEAASDMEAPPESGGLAAEAADGPT